VIGVCLILRSLEDCGICDYSPPSEMLQRSGRERGSIQPPVRAAFSSCSPSLKFLRLPTLPRVHEINSCIVDSPNMINRVAHKVACQSNPEYNKSTARSSPPFCVGRKIQKQCSRCSLRLNLRRRFQSQSIGSRHLTKRREPVRPLKLGATPPAPIGLR